MGEGWRCGPDADEMAVIEQDDIYLGDPDYIAYLNEPRFPVPIYDPILFSDISPPRKRSRRELDPWEPQNERGKLATRDSAHLDAFDCDLRRKKKPQKTLHSTGDSQQPGGYRARGVNAYQIDDLSPPIPMQVECTRRKNKLNPAFLIPTPASIEWLLFEKNDIYIEGLLSSLELKFELKGNNEFTVLFAPSTIGSIDKIVETLGTLSKEQYTKARCSANPFELLKKSVFINRSAIKLANIDVFTGLIPKNPDKKFTFSDLCAGPGGFSSYLIWRSQQIGLDVHGYCITLSSEIDIDRSVIIECGSNLSITSSPRGDITQNENIDSFCDNVLKGTRGNGVDVVTADGSVSFGEWEPNKEKLVFRICLCEVIVMLRILKTGGSYVMKTFEIYKEYTISLIWILRNVFNKIAIFKPQASRPASTERFVVCKGFRKPDSDTLWKYLMFVNEELGKKKGTLGKDFHILFVRLSQICDDKEFVSYVRHSNDTLEAAYVDAIRKVNYAKCNNITTGTIHNHALISEKWLKILSLPP